MELLQDGDGGGREGRSERTSTSSPQHGSPQSGQHGPQIMRLRHTNPIIAPITLAEDKLLETSFFLVRYPPSYPCVVFSPHNHIIQTIRQMKTKIWPCVSKLVFYRKPCTLQPKENASKTSCRILPALLINLRTMKEGVKLLEPSFSCSSPSELATAKGKGKDTNKILG